MNLMAWQVYSHRWNCIRQWCYHYWQMDLLEAAREEESFVWLFLKYIFFALVCCWIAEFSVQIWREPVDHRIRRVGRWQDCLGQVCHEVLRNGMWCRWRNADRETSPRIKSNHGGLTKIMSVFVVAFYFVDDSMMHSIFKQVWFGISFY